MKRDIDRQIAYTTRELQDKNMPTSAMKYVEQHLAQQGYGGHGQGGGPILAINDVTSVAGVSSSADSS